MNQEVEIFLWHFINHRQDDWANWLSLAEFSIANQVSTATSTSPFYVTQGQHPWTENPIEGLQHLENKAVGEFVKRMKEIQWQVEESSKKAWEIMKAKYDSHKKPITYEEGQKVWLDISNFTSEWPSKKLDHKRYGPFNILEKCGSSSYHLKLPKTWKIFPIFNEALLTPYAPPSFPSQQPEHDLPPPEIIDNDEEYEIKEILDSRVRWNKLYYLVHWLSYPRNEDSWIPASETNHCQDLVRDFHKTHPCAPSIANLQFMILKKQDNERLA
jgi:hypothetical protein